MNNSISKRKINFGKTFGKRKKATFLRFSLGFFSLYTECTFRLLSHDKNGPDQIINRYWFLIFESDLKKAFTQKLLMSIILVNL